MNGEREMPGMKLTREHLQIICCRYYSASQFIHDKQVLEVGCGAGLGLGYLARSAERIIGGDISEEALRCAKHHYRERTELVCLDAHALPFKNNTFDVVMSMEVLYYLSQPHKFLDECRRVLVDQGILILSTINPDVPAFGRSPFVLKYFSAAELSALLNRHHFDVELFGAFPISRSPIELRSREAILKVIVKALNLISKGKELRGYLSQLVFRKPLVLKEEIEDSNMIGNFHLTPLPCDVPDPRHRIIYALAHHR